MRTALDTEGQRPPEPLATIDLTDVLRRLDALEQQIAEMRQEPARRPATANRARPGGGGKRLTPEQDQRIAAMLREGRPYSEIGATVGVAPTALTCIWERLVRDGLLGD